MDLSEGWYGVENPQTGMGLRVEWDLSRSCPTSGTGRSTALPAPIPWYGRHYNIGLEPFSSYPTSGLGEAVEKDTALRFGPYEEKRFRLRVGVIWE